MTSAHARDTCETCGAAAPDAAAALTWTVTIERGRRWTCCESCSREHLRAIEGGLDPAWW